jgi:5-methyltetrahydropteroyltriglutamate--homocysteine methyltransferase
MRHDPPFRAEHIGSLLRPPELLAARQSFDAKQLSAEALREVKDRWIREDAEGRTMRYRTPVVTGRLERVKGIATDEFTFVRGLTSRTVKVTLPSPCSQHFFRWREGVSEQAYPDLDVAPRPA